MSIDRRHFLASAAAMLTAGLSACGGGDSGGDAARTTVLVYLLGSDLESWGGQATHNLQEALSVPGNPQVRVLVTTGGANKVDPSGLVSSWKSVKRFELADGRLSELADIGLHNMDEPATLQEFLTWGCSTAPAERYMLMMWDHGAGYNGFGSDENFPDSPGIMRMPGMASALSGFKKTTGITLDYIGFDACLMATVEVAHVLHPYARFLGASQELEPGSGWDWQANMRALSNQPDMGAIDFGRISAEAFVAKQQRESQGHPIMKIASLADYVTFSIIDLSQTAELMQKLETWAQAVLASYSLSTTPAQVKRSGSVERIFWPPLLPQGPLPVSAKAAQATEEPDPTIEHFKQIALQRLRAASFGNEAIEVLEQHDLDLVDLGHFSALLAAQGIAAKEQQDLGAAIGRAVKINSTGPRAANATGLSIYFPKGRRPEQQASVYAQLAMPAAYLQLIARHLGQTAITPSVMDVAPLRTSPVGPSYVESAISSMYGVEAAHLLLLGGTSTGQNVLMGILPLVGGYAFEPGLVLFDTDKWLLLDGQPLILDTVRYELNGANADGEDHGAYIASAPVVYRRVGDGKPQPALLIVRLTKSEGLMESEILGLQNFDMDGSDAPPGRVDIDLAVGDVLEPIYIAYDPERNEAQTNNGQLIVTYGTPVTLTETSMLAPGALPAGQYQLQLQVTDFAGESKSSTTLDFAKI